MAIETELKFRIPAQRLAAVRRAVATASANVQPLAAVYFDTPGEHLAAARMALRLRREGDVWVQTLKAEGAGALQRLEDNVPLPGALLDALPAALLDTLPGAQAAGQTPMLDLQRHQHSPAGAALRKVLAQAGADQTLRERYATSVQRTRRLLRSGGAVVELALDEGTIRAGGRELPVCEIEFELLSGPPQALLALAARWAARFGLLLDMRSKSERGHLLAASLAASPPAIARPLHLPRHAGAVATQSAMVANTLRQVLANASQMAEGPHTPEHLHQLRVGLRRLRSVLRLAPPGAATADPAQVQAHDDLAAACSQLFTQLGAARDDDALAAWLWPALQAAGAPLAVTPVADERAAAPVDLGALLRTVGTQQLWLALLARSLPAPTVPHAQAAGAREWLAPQLQQLQRRVRRDARRFATLDDPARHRLRRRIKRLRYLAELSQGLWPAKQMRRLLKRLKTAQAPLGDFNDTVVALERCRALAETDPHAWFAVGWLTARRESLLPLCSQALAHLASAAAPWPAR